MSNYPLFGPTPNKYWYQSIPKHRQNISNGPPSQWINAILPCDEYEIFLLAEQHGWCDQSGHYWGIYKNGQPLGKDGELYSKHRLDTPSPGTPVHGYPESPKKLNRPLPPDNVVDDWVDRGMKKVTARKILKRQV